MSLLAAHAAVLDEAAGRALLELDGVAPVLAAVGAGFNPVIFLAARHDVHCGIDDVVTMTAECSVMGFRRITFYVAIPYVSILELR